MQDVYWTLFLGIRKGNRSNIEQAKKVSFDAVATMTSDNPPGSPPYGVALQSFRVLK